MSQVRSYTLKRYDAATTPGLQDEKRPLVEDLTRWYVLVLKAPVRQALLAQWWQMPLLELRFIHRNWSKLIASRKPEVN